MRLSFAPIFLLLSLCLAHAAPSRAEPISWASRPGLAPGRYSPLLGNTFQVDRRSRLQDTSRPWSAVGELMSPGETEYCSATLVGRDLILTAAHCIFDENKQLMQGEFKFYPEYGNSDGTSASVTYFWYGTNDTANYQGADWAILRLDAPLGDTYGWMGVAEHDVGDLLTNNESLFLVAYAGDFMNGNFPYWENGCHFTRYMQAQGFLLHDCSMTRGSSGGGMFYQANDAKGDLVAYIVAINVAEYRDGGEKSLQHIPYSDDHANLAVPASAFLPTLKSILAK